MKVDNRKVLSRSIAILLLLFNALFSMFAFMAYAGEEDNKFASYNVFSQKNLNSYQQLEQRKKVLQQRAEFMVFDDEQAKIQNQLLDVLKSQINEQPYNVSLWRDLVFAQSESNNSVQSRIWGFFVWKKMHEWNTREQINFIAGCGFFIELEKTQSFSLACTELLKRVLKTIKASTLAHSLKLSILELSELASHYDVELKSKGQ